MESCLLYHLPVSVPAAGSGASIWPWLKLTNPRKQWVPSPESLGLTARWRRSENLFYAFPRLCKQRIQRVAFLIGFTSMRTSNKKKSVLRLIFVLFCFVGILLSRKANKIIEEAYVSVIVGVVIPLSPVTRPTSYRFVCLLCIQILTLGTCNCSDGNCCLNKKRYSTWGKIPSPVGLWTQG